MTESKRRCKIRPRPFRLAGYLLWTLIMAVMYFLFRSFLLLFFSCFLILIPLISFVLGWVMARCARWTVNVPAVGPFRVVSDVFPVIIINNPLFIGTFDLRVSIGVTNITWDKPDPPGVKVSSAKKDLSVSLPLIGRGIRKKIGESKAKLPLTITRIGAYRLTIREVTVQDWLGLFCYRMTTQSSKNEIAEFIAIPGHGPGKRPDPETIASGMTEVEESHRRGNDYAEVTDIREYIPGDRIRDIHWKLSAKQIDDTWMVKVRTQMAGMELTVVIAPDRDEEKTEELYIYAYRELSTWADGETDIKLRIYEGAAEGFASFTITAPADVDTAFEKILRLPYNARIVSDGSKEALSSLIANLYPYQGGFVRFGVLDDGTVGWELIGGGGNA